MSWDIGHKTYVNGTGPTDVGPVLYPMTSSYVLWPSPMSYGPVLCPMALISMCMSLQVVIK